MQELIERITTRTGLGADTAQEAVAIILDFLNKNAKPEQMQKVFEALPGAEELLDARPDAASKGGILSGLGSLVPGMGAMAALNELTAAGLSLEEVRSVVRQIVGLAREKAGDDVVDAMVSKIPGLSQIL